MYETSNFTNLSNDPNTPKPCGYKVILAMPKVKEKTDGGLYLTDDHKDREGLASILGYVVALGPDAYGDPARFPNGPWCAAGDWVVIKPYAGTRITVGGQEFRIINDNTVEAVVSDPTHFKRAI